MGKFVSVVKHVGVREFIVRTLCVMCVSVEDVKKNVVPSKFSIGKLVSVVKLVDVRGNMICALYVMHVGVSNLQESVVL